GRNHGILGHPRVFGGRPPGGACRGSPARRQRITGYDEIVNYGAALKMPERTPGSLRVDRAHRRTVLGRVGVAHPPRRPALRGLQALPATITMEIADQHDAASHVDPELG